MQLTTTTPLAFPAANNTWDAVRYWASGAERFSQATLACQVMAGFALKELHQANKISQGKRTDLNLPNGLVSSHDGKSWPEIVKAESGISDETARNWMKMAEGVKARWKKLPIRDRLNALMTVPPSQWAESDAKLISDAVHKATDGRTQLEFMWELGIAKNPGGGRGRKPGDGGRPKDMGMCDGDEDDHAIDEFRGDLRLLSHPDEESLDRMSTGALLKHQEEVTAYAAKISTILKRRKALAMKSTNAPAQRPPATDV